MATFAVTQKRSSNGSNQRQLDTLRSLGLRRIGHTVDVADCPQARGMVHAVRHLVEVQEKVQDKTQEKSKEKAQEKAA